MSHQLIVKSDIKINAPLAKVWDALVNPQKTKMYMFGCEAVSDWKVGNPLIWRAKVEGKEVVFVKGIVLHIQTNRQLKYSVIDPNASYPDVPENYLNVTYDLSEKGGVTHLMVLQDGFENAAEGEKRYIDTYNKGEGWNSILVAIKQLVEGK
ncbi:MAG: SRPBCC domain-containing protein [Bacteroidia bacterium]